MNWKKIILALLAMGLIGGAIGLYMYNKPHKNYTKAKVEITIQAKELIIAFENDESAANEAYLNKIIAVTGRVEDISEAGNGEVSIALEDLMFGVTCTLDPSLTLENEKVRKAKVGDIVTLKGRCDGVLTDVRLSKCSFVN